MVTFSRKHGSCTKDRKGFDAAVIKIMKNGNYSLLHMDRNSGLEYIIEHEHCGVAVRGTAQSMKGLIIKDDHCRIQPCLYLFDVWEAKVSSEMQEEGFRGQRFLTDHPLHELFMLIKTMEFDKVESFIKLHIVSVMNNDQVCRMCQKHFPALIKESRNELSATEG